MNRVNLVHIIESCSGGSLEYLIQICNFLNESQKWDIHIIYSRRIDTPLNFKSRFQENITFHEVFLKREISITSDIRGIVQINKILKQINPEIIHLHSSKAGFLGRICALKYQKKIIYTPHGFSFMRKDISTLKKIFFWMLEFIAARIGNHQFLVGSVQEYKYALKLAPNSRVTLIKNSVQIPQFEKIIKDNFEKIKLITVGRLTEAKNPELILDIIQLLKEKYNNFEFIWVGDGELRGYIEQQAVSRQINILVTGWKDKNQLNEILKNSDIYLQGSKWEALPLSLLEAMSFSLPVVVSDIPAHSDIIEKGITGFLASDPEEFVNHIIWLIQDPQLRVEIGENARNEVINHYSSDQFNKKLYEYYVGVVKLTLA